MMSTRVKRFSRVLTHLLLLMAIFILAVLFFEKMMEGISTEEASDMAQTTFPLIYMQRNDTEFNCLHGYAEEMDPTTMRGSITPLSADRSIDVKVDTFAGSLESLSYQVYDPDGQELENTQVLHLTEDNGVYSASMQLQNKILMDQEYTLCLKAVSAGRSVYYYTHVLLADGLHADEYLDFVTGFYEKTVNGTDLSAVAAAVEPDETTDEEQTLAFMDIHDSVSQLTWGELNPQIYYKPTPEIKEINDNTATVTNEYRISAVNENGQTERYNVTEYYRLRFTDSRVYLLNFERYTSEIFDPDNDVIDATGIRLGITGKEISYCTDEKDRVVAFVQENALWSYERSTGRLTRIFSFPQDENIDARDFYSAHNIDILSVSSEGDVCFCVSGYMNRGSHEGRNGTALYVYQASTDLVEEKIFLSSRENTDLLMRSVSRSAYVTSDIAAFSVLVSGTLYRADISSGEVTVLAEGIADDGYAGTAGCRYFAYLPDGKSQDASSLIQVDLETGTSVTIEAPEGEYMRPVAYLNEDLVYGLAREEDIGNASLESGYFPMYALKIVDGSAQELKTYTSDDYVVCDVEQSEHLLTLTRMKRTEDGFTSAAEDQIVDTNTQSAVSLGSATKLSERKQTEVYLRVGSDLSDTSVNVVYSKMLSTAADRETALAEEGRQRSGYYVYAKGGLYDIFGRVNEALVKADETFGVVLDSRWQYVWVRGDKGSSSEIDLDKVPQVMADGVDSYEAFAAGIDGQALDLTGCTLEQVLYFVSHGTPVAALTDHGSVTIVGYDEYNTFLLDPGSEEWYYYGMNDSTEMFAAAGNVFFTCMN